MKTLRKMIKRAFQPIAPAARDARLDAQKGAIGGIPEQVIAIAVGVLMVSGMIALGSRAFTSGKINTALANMNSIATGVRSIHSNVNTYGTADLDQLLQNAEIIPASMWAIPGTANGNLLSVWGADVTVTGVTGTFTVSYDNIPQAECIELMTRTPSEGVVDVSATTGGPLVPPVTPLQAQAACSDATDNDMLWEYR